MRLETLVLPLFLAACGGASGGDSSGSADSGSPAGSTTTSGTQPGTGTPTGTTTGIGLPTDGLVFHFDASDGIWADDSPASHAIQDDGAPPTVEGFGELSVARFDGSQSLHIPDFDGLTLTSEYTVVIIGDANSPSDVFVAGPETGTELHGLLVESSEVGSLRALHRAPFGQTGGEDVRLGAQVAGDGVLHTFWVTRSSVDLSASLDGDGAATPVTQAPFAANLDLTLGKLGPTQNSRFLEGRIAEVLIYDRPIAPGDEPELDAHLQRWD